MDVGFNDHTIFLDINRCITLFTLIIRAVRALSQAAVGPWRSRLLLVHVVSVTEPSLLMSWGELSIETARNNSCAITIVGYHGNPLYRVVASIPIWVTVTSLAILVTCGRFPWKGSPVFPTCGRFPWEAPTNASSFVVKSCRCLGLITPCNPWTYNFSFRVYAQDCELSSNN
jgi:hypothetical protein